MRLRCFSYPALGLLVYCMVGVMLIGLLHMMNRFFNSLSIFAVGALSATIGWQILSGAWAAPNNETYKLLNLFGDVFDRVRADYIEKPDENKMIEAALKGMVGSLDPHSDFLTAAQYKDMSSQTSGEFGGLGIEIGMQDGYVKVVSPIDNTPAQRAGILPNDFVIKINGTDVQGLSLDDARDQMRGTPGTDVRLTVLRKGRDPFELKLVREKIVIKSVKSSVEGGDVGYIRISSFTQQTQAGLDRALADFKQQLGEKLKGYVIDLRNDPGGLLDQAISVSDTFLDKGEIVSTRSRLPEETQRYSAQKGDAAEGKPVVVLVNGGSASASEIVAGALQDQKRATLIGTRSFGKGSVQVIIPLSDQGALRLTTARYYTPAGRSIQARGIDPDIIIEQAIPPDMQAKPIATVGEASLRGHLKNEKDGEESGGSLAYVPSDRDKDVQLKAAIDLVHGVKVVSNVKAVTDKNPVDKASANNKKPLPNKPDVKPGDIDLKTITK